MRTIRVNVRKWVRQFLGLGDSPHSIALAAALGMAIGFGPTYGFQILLALAAAMLLRCNKVAAVLPVFITNPLTAPPIIFLQYTLGRVILGGGSHRDIEKARYLAEAIGGIHPADMKTSVKVVWAAARDLSWGVLGPTLLGMVISSIVLGVVTYPLVYRWVVWFRRKRAERSELRKRNLQGTGAGAGPEPQPTPGQEGAAAPQATASGGPAEPPPAAPAEQENGRK
jgi:hypothetical protein